MIIALESNPEVIENGEYVAFITGKKSINTYPSYLRIGIVIDAKNWIVQELSTGKEWKVYTQSVIKVDKGIRVKGVRSKLETVDQI